MSISRNRKRRRVAFATLVAALVLIPSLLGDGMLRRLRLNLMGAPQAAGAATGAGSERSGRSARGGSRLSPVPSTTAQLPATAQARTVEAAETWATPGGLSQAPSVASVGQAATDASGPGLTFLDPPGGGFGGGSGGGVGPLTPGPQPDPGIVDPPLTDPAPADPPPGTDPGPVAPVLPVEILPSGVVPPAPPILPPNDGDPSPPGVITPTPLSPGGGGGDRALPILPDTPRPDERRPAPMPEPGAWALMILGFGLVGALARRRRTRSA